MVDGSISFPTMRTRQLSDLLHTLIPSGPTSLSHGLNISSLPKHWENPYRECLPESAQISSRLMATCSFSVGDMWSLERCKFWVVFHIVSGQRRAVVVYSRYCDRWRWLADLVSEVKLNSRRYKGFIEPYLSYQRAPIIHQIPEAAYQQARLDKVFSNRKGKQRAVTILVGLSPFPDSREN